MSASLRGHQGQFKVYENGQPVEPIPLTSVDINQDSSFSKTFYVGNGIPEGDQVIEGFSGTLEMEVKDDKVERFIDALITNNLNGIGVSDYSMISTEQYANGQNASYVYYDCQFRLSKRQGGSRDKMTKRLDFQCSGRQRL